MKQTSIPDICDYEGSTYRTDFWEGQGRDYEDRVERIAIRRLMRGRGGQRLLEVGAGFGRLSGEWAAYDQVVLLDYSCSQLEYARQQLGDDKYLYVAANLYQLPFAPAAFDAVTLIRVIHHLADAPAALRQMRSVLRSSGDFLLEYANKQNLKAIARWLLRAQAWNPFDTQPVEFVPLNFNFHPRYIAEALPQAGLRPGRTLTVSHFRIGIIKRLFPAGLLAWLDAGAQLTGDLWQLTPSVFTLCQAEGPDEQAPPGAFWRCPACGSFDLHQQADGLTCAACGATYPIINGVYDFKGEG